MVAIATLGPSMTSLELAVVMVTTKHSLSSCTMYLITIDVDVKTDIPSQWGGGGYSQWLIVRGRKSSVSTCGICDHNNMHSIHSVSQLVMVQR